MGFNAPDLAERYLRYHATEHGRRSDERSRRETPGFDAWSEVHEVVHERPDDAWPLLLELVERADVTSGALAYVAAGPLEDFVRLHGLSWLDHLESQARANAKFRLAMQGVWGWNDFHPDLRSRLIRFLGRDV